MGPTAVELSDYQYGYDDGVKAVRALLLNERLRAQLYLEALRDIARVEGSWQAEVAQDAIDDAAPFEIQR